MTTPRFELTSQCHKVSRLPTEPPGRLGMKNKGTLTAFYRILTVDTCYRKLARKLYATSLKGTGSKAQTWQAGFGSIPLEPMQCTEMDGHTMIFAAWRHKGENKNTQSNTWSVASFYRVVASQLSVSETRAHEVWTLHRQAPVRSRSILSLRWMSELPIECGFTVFTSRSLGD